MDHIRQKLVFDAVDRLSGLKEVPEVGAALGATMEQFGFWALGLNGLPPPGEGADPVILTEKTPGGFRDLYIEERFYIVDHIAAQARIASSPFRYCEAPYDRSQAHTHERFMQALRSFHMGDGIIVPIGRLAALPACVWLGGEDPDLDDNSVLAVQLIALFAAAKGRALLRKAGPPPGYSNLSAREREVLQWTAAGKTSWEISMISNLSERAINKIIADAMTKLDAVTRAQAVVNAIRLGEIEY